MIQVVDANIACAFLLPLPHRAQARALLQGANRLIAPDLLIAEVANVAWKLLRARRIDRAQAVATAASAHRPFAELVASQLLARRAIELAADLDHPAHDCFYLALAEAREAKFVTADVRFATKASQAGFARLIDVIGT